MPQMMPLYWMMMILTTIILLTFITSFTFFFYLPILSKSPNIPLMKFNWLWLW